VCGSVCTRWVGLHVIAERLKINFYLHVGKNSLSTGYFLKARQI